MALSPEEISRINRQNAARSTGPSEAGKRKSRMNSTVHGLTATKVVLPNESEAEVQQLMDDWTTHYRATSPGRRELVDRAVTATLHHQRSKRYLAATLREQVRNAERAFDEEQENLVQHYVELLPVEPSAAIRGLRRTAAGCRWIIRAWFDIESKLIDGIPWMPSLGEHATRLLGHKPQDHRTDEESYKILYLAVTANAEAPPKIRAALLDPRAMPDTLRHMRERPLPTPEHSFQELLKVVHDQLTEYEALARQLRIEVEEPARAAAVDKAVMLKGHDLALWIRYERMHDSMFHRSYNTLERPEAPRPEPEPEPEPAAPVEAPTEEDAAASAPAEPADGPVVTDEPRVERQSKRLATDAPVAPAPIAAVDAEAPGHDASAGVAGAESSRSRCDGPAGLGPSASQTQPRPPTEAPHIRMDTVLDAAASGQDASASPDAAAAVTVTNRWRGPPIPGDPVGGML
jgi:hypothetical protein